MASFIFWATLAVVALAPLPLASNRPWSWSLLSLLIGLLLVLWAFAVVRDRSILLVQRSRYWPAAIILAALVLWFLVQASPLTPVVWHHPLWQQAGEALGRPISGAISLNPMASETTLMRLIGYAGVFWLGLQFGRNADRARQIFWMLATAGLLYSIYGLVIDLGGYNMILWYDKWAYQLSLTSTFVNRNNFAAYAGLALIVTLALMVPELGKSLSLGLKSRAGIVHFLDHAGIGLFFLVVAFAVIATALLLSHSRGALVSTAIGIAVFLGMMAINRRMRMGAIVVAASALGAAAYVLLSFSGEMTLVRLAELAADSGGRSVVQDLTAQAIGDAPITGTGLGTYGEVFQIYRDGRFGPQTPSYDKAHNTYLEFALEAGLPAFAAMMLVLGGIAALCLRGVLRRRRNVIYPAAGVAATALIGVHSAIDFPLQIPAIAVTYMLLMGTAYAQSWSRRSDGGRSTTEGSLKTSTRPKDDDRRSRSAG